jgi:F-type H+-transporting ATPase subunit delta
MLTGTRAVGVTRPRLILVKKINILNRVSGGRWKHPRPCPYEVKVATEKAHETGLAGRYANAVFELAQEQGLVDVVAADFAALKTAMTGSADFTRLIKSPLFSHEDQARALKPILEKMGVNALTMKFLLTLTNKRRLFALSNIIAAYGRLVARLKGEVEAEVTSAHALTAAQTAELKSVLKSKLGREPRLDAHVDPTLLGGLVVKVGSRMIDSSLRTKLAGIRAVMRG